MWGFLILNSAPKLIILLLSLKSAIRVLMVIVKCEAWEVNWVSWSICVHFHAASEGASRLECKLKIELAMHLLIDSKSFRIPSTLCSHILCYHSSMSVIYQLLKRWSPTSLTSAKNCSFAFSRSVSVQRARSSSSHRIIVHRLGWVLFTISRHITNGVGEKDKNSTNFDKTIHFKRINKWRQARRQSSTFIQERSTLN